MVSAGGQQFDAEEEERRRRRQQDDGGGDAVEAWWSDCVPDSCSSPNCSTPDCMPDCVPGCDFNLTMLSLIALTRPGRPARTRPTGPARAGIAAIRGYQRWVSHRLGTRCRHTPTCSNYGLAAVGRYGLVTGSRLTAARLGRCKAPTPYGTVDEVP